MIFKTNNLKPLDNIEPDFTNPDAVYISGMEVSNLEANKTIEVDTDLLDAELKKLGSDAKFEYLEGRSHFDMYQDGLGDKIANEMY